jgi:glucokinase
MNVLTLDAGGTNFVFSAICDGKRQGDRIQKPAYGDNLDKCLTTIIEGFNELLQKSANKADAISFAFPGPADFSMGIIGNLHNLPAFRGGVALGPMLSEKFNLPVYINNDGDLYAYGEALSGTLPMINTKLQDSRNPKQYKNIFGMTIGTGFGGGLVHNGILIKGDSIAAGEIWVTSNRQSTELNSEEGVSIRAVRHFFSEFANININDCPQPKEIFEIGIGKIKGNKEAAILAYNKLGKFIGDSIANMITLFDGIVVIGGGIAGAKELIIPGIKSELERGFNKLNGGKNPRLTHKVFCLNYENEMSEFVKPCYKSIKLPFSDTEINYNYEPRSAFMFSNFDTSEMISMGAYYYAAEQLKTK